MRGEPVIVDHDIIGAKFPSPANDIDHPWNAFETTLQHPVLQGLQVHHRIALRPRDLVPENFANWTRRRQRWLCAASKRGKLRQAVDDLLLCFVVGQIIAELEFDVGQPEQRDCADCTQMRDARHADLDRDGDIALHLFG